MAGLDIWTPPQDWATGTAITETKLHNNLRDNLTVVRSALDGDSSSQWRHRHASGTLAARPAALAGNVGRLYLATDTNELYLDSGGTWQLVSEYTRLRDFFIPAALFAPASGTPTLANIGSWGAGAHGFTFSDTVFGAVIGHHVLAADYASGTIKFFALYQGGGTGNFRLSVQAAAITADNTESMKQTSDFVDTLTFAAINAVDEAAFTLTLTVAAGDYLNIGFARLGADALDTSPNVCEFYGVRCEYTADY